MSKELNPGPFRFRANQAYLCALTYTRSFKHRWYDTRCIYKVILENAFGNKSYIRSGKVNKLKWMLADWAANDNSALACLWQDKSCYDICVSLGTWQKLEWMR